MPTVALTLGSGGARGLAHIGVIQWLEEHDFEIVAVAGSSIGALVGGIYAAGKLPVYRDWVCSLGRGNVLRMLDLSFSRAGLFKGEKIIAHLSSMIGDTLIEDLPIPYTAVATDINRERPVWLNEGSLFKAIRSSIAVPTVFTPQFHQGRWLVDGGLVDPVPVAATRHVPADLNLAVNLNHPTQDLKLPFERPEGDPEPLGNSLKNGGGQQWFSGILDSIRSLHKGVPEEENSLNMVDVLFRSFDIMQAQITESRLAAYRPDIVINLERAEGGFFDYDKADQLIRTGYRLAEEALGHHLPRARISRDEA
ncbi:serine protease [Natronospirillum operosum]|uniref:Serine protease n=1 Tax=Natronospirillum operosum TaxID=2759953 RepID=A0A4Z0WFE0_9GAMM|nr:patatin-like phospholipase family protein [Natronospirillum operosum]TGG93210.1 serine protease [Natronospirillum operosum]